MHYIEILRDGSTVVCNSIIDFFLREYLSDHSIDLTVVHKDLSGEFVDGWCLKEEDNKYLIEIEYSLNGEEYMRTLLHELYHVYQSLNGYQDEKECYEKEEEALDTYLRIPLE